MINEELAKRLNLSPDRINNIENLHVKRDIFHKLMREEDDPEVLRIYDEGCTEIEFALQREWGFPENKDYHKFWERPKCRCPSMDNYDRFPFGYYYFTESCPLHGFTDEETE